MNRKEMIRFGYGVYSVYESLINFRNESDIDIDLDTAMIHICNFDKVEHGDFTTYYWAWDEKEDLILQIEFDEYGEVEDYEVKFVEN